VTAIVLVVGAAACANPEYDRSTVERDLERDSGLTAAQAACVARRLEDTVGERRLGARDTPSPAERAYLHSALVFAGVACSGRPFDVAKVQRFLVDKAKVGAADARCLVEHAVLDVGADQLAAGDNLTRAASLKVRGALAWGAVSCIARDGEAAVAALRENAGVNREQALCLRSNVIPGEPALPVGAEPQDRAAIVERCTSASATTTSSSTTTRPSSTPSS
jgi:hypothetical protein